MHQTGRLVGVEVNHGPKTIVDFELINPDQVVEFKYWTQQYTEKNIDRLLGQLERYKKTNKPVVLEFGITKTKPITTDFVEQTLKSELVEIDLAFEDFSIDEEAGVITIQLKTISP